METGLDMFVRGDRNEFDIPLGYISNAVMIPHAIHLFIELRSTRYMNTRKGKAHSCPISATRVSSPNTSAAYVSASMAITCSTLLGITNRFVLKVSKPSPFNERVR